MDKITDAFAAAKSSVVNEDAEGSSYSDQLKDLPNNFESFPNLKSISQSKAASENLYNEFIAMHDNNRQFEPFHQSYDFRKRLAAVGPLRENSNRYCTDDKIKRQDTKNPSARGCQKQSVANVGVPEKLFKKLESSGKNVAQLGTIKFSESKQNMLEESCSSPEVNMNSRSAEHQNLQKSSLLQGENDQNRDVRITDYTLTPIYLRGFNQQQAEIHAEMENDKDEMSSGGYVGRSAFPKLRKFKKFRSGKKRGHKKKKQEKRPRQNIANQQITSTQMEDDEVDYEENANNHSNREKGRQNVLDGYRNSDDSETVKEQETHGNFEKDEPTFVKPNIPSDLFENFEKINVIPSGDKQQFPEEEEDEHYLEWAQKKSMPIDDGIHYNRYDRDYRQESKPSQEVDINKRQYDERNKFEKYKANNLVNPDTQIELERTQVNINDNANYKPLEMPQYDYDEDNKQIVFIHNNKKYNSKNNMAYTSAKNLNFGPANLNSFENKNSQIHKAGSKEGGNQNDLKSSHTVLEGKRKNFETVDPPKNNMNVQNKDNKDFQKIIINSNKLLTASKIDDIKNKYHENGYNYNFNDQSGRKSNFDVSPTAKHDFFSQNLNKMESPNNSENKFKPHWNKNSDNDIKINSKGLESDDMGVRFDVDEIIRQNYKMPVTLQSAENQARLLLNNEPPQFLPKRPPYSRIIDDPNLNIKDKLGVLDIIDTKNENADNVQNEIYNDILNSYVILATPSPSPIEAVTINPKMISVRKTPDNSKKKRSFIFYDDLEMRDTLMDNDYNFDDVAQQRRGRDREQSVSRHVQEDVSPCATCGGKGKKPIQKNPAFNPQENACRCRNQRTICTCPDARKKVRSVSDAWYAVFNMSAPLPFLTTKLRIFRKRHNIWWKIVPSIT